MPNLIKPAEFWNLPEADEEAGQDKLRSAVEWGVFQRNRKTDGAPGRLLNLKPGLSDGYFAREGRIPAVTGVSDRADPEEWIEGIPSGAFDEIFALDFFQLHPDFEEGMAGLSRALNEGGILFLNFFSRDHFRLADSLPGPEGEGSLRQVAAMPPNPFTPEQVSETALRHGLQVREIIPYSSFYGNSLWVDLMNSRYRWEWFLDLLSSDRNLFRLALFLEEGLVARLGTAAAPRFIAVLEKTGQQEESRACLEREASLRKAHASGLDPTWLENAAGMPLAELRGILEGHLGELRNLAFFHQLWTLLPVRVRDAEGPAGSAWLPDRAREEFLKWQAQERMDSRCLDVVRGWHGIMPISRKLRHRGVPLGPGLQYEQVHALLRSGFGCFGKGGSR